VDKTCLGIPAFGGTNLGLALLHKTSSAAHILRRLGRAFSSSDSPRDGQIAVFNASRRRSDHPQQVPTYPFHATKGDPMIKERVDTRPEGAAGGRSGTSWVPHL
jgi:hypothetical protein